MVDKAGGKPDRLLVAQNKAEHEAISSLFWATLRKRLGAPAYGGDGLGLRAGYKVVQRQDEMDSFLKTLVAIATHDCTNCEGYEECDLSHKEPRRR